MTNAPKFCGQCGAALPPGDPRFCVECGNPLRSGGTSPEESSSPAATGATVRLSNARVEQAVIGGTIRLATSHAVPPGLWRREAPPDETQVVALYAPLRAVVGGWSATTSDGWEKIADGWAGAGWGICVRFRIAREWFAAPGFGQGLRLQVQIGAESYAEEGRTRRGFTYRVASDPPMQVLGARWVDGRGTEQQLPTPQIQLMAPPRVRRVSDLNEQVRQLNLREAETWARQGVVHSVFRLEHAAQQRTPVGRGLVLAEAFGGTMLAGVTGKLFTTYRIQMRNPLEIRAGEWRALNQRMLSDAAKLGLDLGTDAATEWWIDQHGYDGAIFDRGAYPLQRGRVAVAFRRSQVAEVRA